MLLKKQSIHIISFDIFRTLVDLDSRAPKVYERIFLAKGKPSQIRRFWSDIGHRYRIELSHSLSKERYEGFAPLFVRVMEWIKNKYNLTGSAENYKDILIEEEKQSCLFPDALETIHALSKHFTLCVVSDTDPDMVTSILPSIPIQKKFLSYDHQAYKEDPQNKLFQAVIDDFKVYPTHILHIGDSYSDVIGSKRLSMNSVWINRYKPWYWWKHKDIKPDYTITALKQLIRLF